MAKGPFDKSLECPSRRNQQQQARCDGTGCGDQPENKPTSKDHHRARGAVSDLIDDPHDGVGLFRRPFGVCE